MSIDREFLSRGHCILHLESMISIPCKKKQDKKKVCHGTPQKFDALRWYCHTWSDYKLRLMETVLKVTCLVCFVK